MACVRCKNDIDSLERKTIKLIYTQDKLKLLLYILHRKRNLKIVKNELRMIMVILYRKTYVLL